MMTEHKLSIDFNTDVTVSDILTQNELDVTSLKQDNPDAPVREHVDQSEEFDARSNELSAIDAYIAKNGVTTPTPEDFKPKSQSWRGKKSHKTDAQIDRRGRPRKKFKKDVTFVLEAVSPEGEAKDQFKRAGRGRAKKGEMRLVFALHYTNLDKAIEGTWTRAELVSMAKKAS
tara:strand:+ start:536 stop:1054 length:519 start_codon:yes stop_codon:yes gene_type:complete